MHGAGSSTRQQPRTSPSPAYPVPNADQPHPCGALHCLAHLPEQLELFGPLRDIWEFYYESLLGFLKRAGVQNRAHPEAAICSRLHFHSCGFLLEVLVQVRAPAFRTVGACTGSCAPACAAAPGGNRKRVHTRRRRQARLHTRLLRLS